MALKVVHSQLVPHRLRGATSYVLPCRSHEVERAIDYVIEVVRKYPRDNKHVVLSEQECCMFRRHHSRLMYQVLLLGLLLL